MGIFNSYMLVYQRVSNAFPQPPQPGSLPGCTGQEFKDEGHVTIELDHVLGRAYQLRRNNVSPMGD